VSAPLVRVDGLCKRYPVLGHRGDRAHALWDLLRGRAPRRHVVVLDGISFEVHPGQSLGIIGENGAGKSTLLKLITGVLTASAGSIETRGSVGALLELGAGFHPEYSGRENVRMAAALYGLDEAALAQKLPEIEAFADIGEYIDEPVKHYSTGMVVRLGFAVIAAVRPALLITDEVLSVGDEGFQRKCTRWIDDYLAGGGTLLLVSHSMYHVQKLCRQAMWLHEGRIREHGDVFGVTQNYVAWHESRIGRADAATVAPVENGGYVIESISGHPPMATPDTHIEQGDSLLHEVLLRAPDDTEPVLMCGIARDDEVAVYGVSSEMEQVRGEALGGGRYRFRLQFDHLPLLPGSYHLKTHVLDATGLRLYCTCRRALIVHGATRELGIARLPHRWLGPDDAA